MILGPIFGNEPTALFGDLDPLHAPVGRRTGTAYKALALKGIDQLPDGGDVERHDGGEALLFQARRMRDGDQQAKLVTQAIRRRNLVNSAQQYLAEPPREIHNADPLIVQHRSWSKAGRDFTARFVTVATCKPRFHPNSYHQNTSIRILSIRILGMKQSRLNPL